MARVTVAVNVRDMTRGDLQRLRRQMDGMTGSLNRFAGNQSQRNLNSMNRHFQQMQFRLFQMRSSMPNDEFVRMTRNIQRMGAALNTTLGPITDRDMRMIRQNLRDMDREMRRMGSGGRATREIRITARDDTHRGLRSANSSIRRWIAGPLPGLARFAGGTLSDGIGQGFANTFKSNPYVASALTVVFTAAMAVVGAALSGLLVLAIGGAFVGLGGFIAAKSKEFTRVWKNELDQLKPLFKEAAEPMIPVLQHATRVMGGMGKEFAPKLKSMLEEAAPTLNGFIDATKRGFQKLGQHAWDDLKTAFNVFLTAFGPQWEDFLSELGKSLGALARTVTEHSTEIAAALRVVLGIINLLIDTINFFANAWVMGMHFAIDASAMLLKATAFILDGFLSMIDGMLAGLESVASVFGFEDEVARARASFNQMRDDAVGKFNDMAASVKQMGLDMDYANRERELRVKIDAWNAALARAKEELKSVPPEKQSELRGKIDDLTSKIATAQGQLNRMQKDYYVRIHAYKVGDWALGLGGPGQAFGGVTGSHMSRAATGGARSNMTLVGESGPELVDLAPGTHVRSNADTRRLMNQDGGGGGNTTLVIKSGGSRMDDLLLEVLRDAIHRSGGDVVRVLGG